MQYLRIVTIEPELLEGKYKPSYETKLSRMSLFGS